MEYLFLHQGWIAARAQTGWIGPIGTLKKISNLLSRKGPRASTRARPRGRVFEGLIISCLSFSAWFFFLDFQISSPKAPFWVQSGKRRITAHGKTPEMVWNCARRIFPTNPNPAAFGQHGFQFCEFVEFVCMSLGTRDTCILYHIILYYIILHYIILYIIL